MEVYKSLDEIHKRMEEDLRDIFSEWDALPPQTRTMLLIAAASGWVRACQYYKNIASLKEARIEPKNFRLN